MSAIMPNTTVSVLRGETVDQFGDPMDSDESVYAGLPMSITEYDRRIYLAAEGRLTTIRQAFGRIRPGFDIRESDRIRDEKSGRVYLVEGMSTPGISTGTADSRFYLRRIDNQ